MSLDTMSDYGLKLVGSFSIDGATFVIHIIDGSLVREQRCIYAFVIDGKVVRIGSSKGVLARRLAAWERDVSRALAGDKSPTPAWEAAAWKELLGTHKFGEIFARPGTDVETPIGRISAYLDEESVLIGRHRPSLNRNMHR